MFIIRLQLIPERVLLFRESGRPPLQPVQHQVRLCPVYQRLPPEAGGPAREDLGADLQFLARPRTVRDPEGAVLQGTEEFQDGAAPPARGLLQSGLTS